MDNLMLKVESRKKEEDLSSLRREKFIPAVVYGKTQESTLLKMEYSDFLRTFRKSGESSIISLELGKEKIDVLVHQIQKAPVSGDFTHIDFYAITRGEALTTHIHLNFIGDSEGAKLGGILEELIKEVEVKCLPRNLVEHFDVDLSLLKEIGSMVKISDLGIDLEKYELSNSQEDVVAKISAPRVEEDLDAPVETVAVTGADEATEDTEEK